MKHNVLGVPRLCQFFAPPRSRSGSKRQACPKMRSLPTGSQLSDYFLSTKSAGEPPNRSSATSATDNSLGGTFLHWQTAPSGRTEFRGLARRLAVDQALGPMGVELHHPVPHDLNRDPADPGCRGAGCSIVDRGQGQKAPRLRAVLRRAGNRAQRLGIKVCPERNRHGEPPSFATLNQTCLKPTRPNRVTPSGTWYQPSDAAHQQEDDQDHDEQADASTRPIAPSPAVAPGGQGADQDQDQDDQQNGAEAHDGALLCGSAWGRPPSLTVQSSQRDNQG